MNVSRVARALREMADALDDDATENSRRPRAKAIRRIVAPPPAKVDDVTRARAKRLLRANGFTGGES